MRVFVSGGCKNGKSYYAQRLAVKQGKQGDGSPAWVQGGKQEDGSPTLHPLYYIATMRPADAEDDIRIARHREEREGWGFTTLEQPSCIESILDKCDTRGSFLLDSLTALLANEMFPPGGGVNERAAEDIAEGLARVMSGIENIVIVSDYIYSDAIVYDPLTEMYRRFLAGLDRVAAKGCDAVIEVAYAGVIVHKSDDMGKFIQSLGALCSK